MARRVLVLGAVVGCADGDGAVGEPGPGAFAEDFATSAEFFTQMAGPQPSETVHGDMQIWYSVNIRPQIEAGGPFSAPVGTVAIKRQTNGDGSALYNTMIRLEDRASPDGLDWTWEQRDGALEVTASGAIGPCVDCHRAWPDTDALAGTEIR